MYTLQMEFVLPKNMTPLKKLSLDLGFLLSYFSLTKCTKTKVFGLTYFVQISPSYLLFE